MRTLRQSEVRWSDQGHCEWEPETEPRAHPHNQCPRPRRSRTLSRVLGAEPPGEAPSAGREWGGCPGAQHRGRVTPSAASTLPGKDTAGREPEDEPGGGPAAGSGRTGCPPAAAGPSGGARTAEAGGRGGGCPRGLPEGGRWVKGHWRGRQRPRCCQGLRTEGCGDC